MTDYRDRDLRDHVFGGAYVNCDFSGADMSGRRIATPVWVGVALAVAIVLLMLRKGVRR